MTIKTFTKDNFQSEVLDYPGTVLVDFWAVWCGPCRMLSPVVDEIAAERTDIAVGKVNVDDQPDLALRFHIDIIPTLIVFKNGAAVNRLSGVQPKDAITAMLP